MRDNGSNVVAQAQFVTIPTGQVMVTETTSGEGRYVQLQMDKPAQSALASSVTRVLQQNRIDFVHMKQHEDGSRTVLKVKNEDFDTVLETLNSLCR